MCMDKTYFTKRKQEMVELRSQGRTIQQIATVYGISRERVRQVIGNTGYIASPENVYAERKAETKKRHLQLIKKIALLDKPELTTWELARKLNMSYLKTSLNRQIRRHKTNNAFTNIGMAAEEYVSEELSRRGIKNELMPIGHPYDIETHAGKTIDVKTRTHAENIRTSRNFYFFNLRHTERQYRKKEYPDFMALVINKDIFIIPKNKLPECSALGFCWPEGKHRHGQNWQQYHNRFDLLQERK
jgi:hypothetical protein